MHAGSSSSLPSTTSNNITTTSKAAATSAAAAPALPEGRLIQTYAAHGYEVLSLSISRTNARFASAGGDRQVFLWDVSTAQTIRRLGGSAAGAHTARVNCVAFAGAGAGGDSAADESLLISGSLDASVRVWDLRSGGGKPVQVLSEARDSVTSVCVPGGGAAATIVAGSVDGRVRTYDVRAGRCVTDVVGPAVTSVAATRDGRAVLVGALDSRLRLLDRDTGALLRAYAHPCFRNDGLRVQSLLGAGDRYVVVGDEMTAAAAAAAPPDRPGHGRVWAWDILSGEVAARLSVPWGPPGHGSKKVVGRDGKEKERTNVISCLAWRDGGYGDQFCAGGTSGVVTVFGYR